MPIIFLVQLEECWQYTWSHKPVIIDFFLNMCWEIALRFINLFSLEEQLSTQTRAYNLSFCQQNHGIIEWLRLDMFKFFRKEFVNEEWK